MTNAESSVNIGDPNEKIKRSEIQKKFRSNLIGGLNQEDVTNHIVLLEEKYKWLEGEMNRERDEYFSSRKQLEIEKENMKSLQENLDKAQNELAKYIDECKNKDLTLQSIADQKNSEIARLQNELFKMTEKQKELENQLSESNLEIERKIEDTVRLEEENDILKSKIVDLEENNSEIPQLQNELFKMTEKQKELEKQLSIDSEILQQKIISLEETIAENIKEIEEQRKISRGKAEQILKLEKAQVSSNKIMGFKDEIVNIYQKLEELTEEQGNINNELQQQLEVEKLRANEAENSLTELIIWASELKNKLCSEQNLFETQHIKIAERHNHFKSTINGYFVNLEEVIPPSYSLSHSTSDPSSRLTTNLAS